MMAEEGKGIRPAWQWTSTAGPHRLRRRLEVDAVRPAHGRIRDFAAEDASFHESRLPGCRAS
jgi:hypothetical protein